MLDQVVDDIETVGLADERIIRKGDTDFSLTESSRVGESNSKDHVERAIQDLCGLVRTLKSCLEESILSKIHLNNPFVPWIGRHAGHPITVRRVREDGQTAYLVMKCRRTNAELVMFGECVLFKIPKT